MIRKIMFTGIMLVYATVMGFAQIDKSESCYLLIKDVGDTPPKITLESTKVNVQIDGVIADVTVKQTYVNRGDKKLEAVYVFPGSTRAAVYGMNMKVGKRTVIATIKEKQQARKEYDEAKAKGKTASLLEQHRPNVFQMNVANIAPGDSVSIEMNYTELLQYTGEVYEFVYPGLVGPRYDTGGEKWVAQSLVNNLFAGSFSINVEIRTAIPVSFVESPSHEVKMSYPDNIMKVVPANPKDYDSGKDFILKYGLRGGKVQSGLMTYKHNGENFFLMMVQPPEKTAINDIAPREYIFIVDVSGSMYGFPLDVSKNILRNLISSLRPTDRFNVLLFESSNAMMSENSLPATTENIGKAMAVIDRQQGSGGTELYPALKKAFEFKTTPDFARTFIIATDGYVTIEKEAFELTRENRDKFNLFALGIGDGVNRHLIEGLAYAGGGEAYIINNKTEADKVGKRLIKDISVPVLSHIKIDWGTFGAYDITPSPVADLFSAKPVVVYGKYKGDLSGKISIKGSTGRGEFSQVIDVAKAEKTKSQALRYLWARDKVKYLSDYAGFFEKHTSWGNRSDISEKAKEQIIELGLKYNLMTAYTSFLAVDEEEQEEQGNVPITFSDAVFTASEEYIAGDIAVEEMAFVEKKEMTVEMEEELVPEVFLFAIVEEKPTFMGGEASKFTEWVQSQIIYPQAAIDIGVSGIVYLQFTIGADGSVTDIKVLRSVDPLLDNEAIRILKSAPKWKPGKQRNKPVAILYQVPVRFKFNK